MTRAGYAHTARSIGRSVASAPVAFAAPVLRTVADLLRRGVIPADIAAHALEGAADYFSDAASKVPR